MLQIDKIAERIFSILKGYGFKIKIFNEEGNETTDPTKGRRFFIDEPNFMITIDDKDNTIEFNKGKDVDFEKSVELQRRLQKIANNFLVNSTMNVFGKAISPRDFSFRAKMATESTSSISSLIEGLSKMSGSKKTSRQTLENVKIIVRHKVPVNDEVRGSRSRNINSIFLEVDGNRTKFPIVNLPGARAMAQHMAHGGEFNDVVGKYIIENTMRLNKLNEFCRYALSNKLVTEDTQDTMSLVKEHIFSIKNELKKLTGVKTYETVSARIAEFSTNMLVNDKTSEIKDMFTVKRFDEKFNEVLPIINQLINEQDQYRKLIDEVANKPVKVSNLSFNNTPVFEFANKDMELGHKIVNLSLAIVENTDLSAFVASVGNKLCKKTAISEFEYAVVKRVLENIVVRDNTDSGELEVTESKSLDHFFNQYEFGLLLNETDKKTYTGYKDSTKTSDKEIPLAKDNFPLPKQSGNDTNPANDTKSTKLKVASADKTRSKTRNINIPGASEIMKDFDFDETDIDTPTTDLSTEVLDKMPAIISKELRAAGQVEPEFHEVKNLPGYLQSEIRKMGRQVFAPFTSTPIENINVIASLGGQGPNTDAEVNAVAVYLHKSGKRLTDAELTFREKLPGYNVELKMYEAMGHTFMVVRDFAGNYVYSWPSNSDTDLIDKTQLGLN